MWVEGEWVGLWCLVRERLGMESCGVGSLLILAPPPQSQRERGERAGDGYVTSNSMSFVAGSARKVGTPGPFTLGGVPRRVSCRHVGPRQRGSFQESQRVLQMVIWVWGTQAYSMSQHRGVRVSRIPLPLHLCPLKTLGAIDLPMSKS